MNNSRFPDPSFDKTLSYSRALLELTVRENGEAMSTITRIFSEIAYLFSDVEKRCAELSERAPEDPTVASVERDCRAAGVALREGLRAMQLHDITDQRLSHVAGLLMALGEGRRPDIESVLTEEEERALLKLIDSGVAIEDALERLDGTSSQGSVELF